jgi:hypothetical protein
MAAGSFGSGGRSAWNSGMNVSTEVRQLVRKRSRSRDGSCWRQRGKNLYQSRTSSALIDEIAASNDFGLISCAGPPGGGPIDAAYVCVPSSVAFDSNDNLYVADTF